jgi:hypothetical protein
MVKVIDGGAELEEGKVGKKLLRINITAEVDGVRSDYTITYARSGRNDTAVSYTAARSNTPGGRQADAERLSALIKALTGKEPKVHHTGDGRIIIECSNKHPRRLQALRRARRRHREVARGDKPPSGPYKSYIRHSKREATPLHTRQKPTRHVPLM